MYTEPTQIGSNESGGVEVYQDHSYLQNQNNTSFISKEDYDHALDCINGWKNAHDSWKNAHDNLARTGLVENRNWQMAHQKEVEEKHKLSEELHYEKVAKEALPIHMDKNILKKIVY